MRLLKKTYGLEDDATRILIDLKPKGKAERWFQSRSEDRT